MAAAVSGALRPDVTGLRPENLVVPFTDYSRWARKQPKSSVSLQTHTRTLSPLMAPRARKTSKPPAPETKKQRSSTTSTAQVRLQPVCSHGQGIRRKLPTVSVTEVRVQVSKCPERQQRVGRLGRSHEPTNIRLLRVKKPAINDDIV